MKTKTGTAQEKQNRASGPLYIKLIANPAAGKAGDRKLYEIISYLRSRGSYVETLTTQKRGDAYNAALAVKNSTEDSHNIVVVAVGGDGTINEVVNGISGSEVPMGVIPLGTVNLFALETGIPMDIKGACDIILGGRRKKVMTGRVNDRYFLLMAGVGFDADVVYRLDLGLKKKIGKLAYVLTGLSRLGSYPYNRLVVEYDGKRSEASSVVIGNMKYYGGRMSVTPHADFEKDSLDVCIFKRGGALNMARYAWGVISKRHLSFSDVEYATARSITVTAPRKTYVQIDGDIHGTLPAVFSIAEERLTVILPEGNEGGK